MQYVQHIIHILYDGIGVGTIAKHSKIKITKTIINLALK